MEKGAKRAASRCLFQKHGEERKGNTIITTQHDIDFKASFASLAFVIASAMPLIQLFEIIRFSGYVTRLFTYLLGDTRALLPVDCTGMDTT